METDAQLLARYASDNAQDAFAKLVARHIDLVYASARRQVRDPTLADDITQGVFLMLSQRAAKLRSGVILPAWLLTATWYASKNALRTERRRTIHEQRAAQMNAEATTNPPPAPLDSVLDDALASLSTPDRGVVVLHYLKGKSFPEVASELSTTPDAARKRSERALEKLRNRFAKAGINLTVPAVGIELLNVSRIKAPPAMLARIAPTAGATVVAGASATTIAKGALTMMMYAKLKVAAAIALIVALGVSGIVAAEKVSAEPKDPRSALIKLARAIREGDVEGIKAGTVASDPADQPLLDQQANTCKTVAEFKAAYRKAFGEQAARSLPAMVGPLDVPADAPVKIDGDNATVELSGIPIPMVKIAQTWKMPSSALALKTLPMPIDKVVEYNRRTDIAMAETTEAVALGQFQKPQEALVDLQQRIRKASQSMARETPTTAPAAQSGGQGYPRLSPYSAVRWRDAVPEVRVKDTWYELVSIDDQPAAKIIEFAKTTYGERLWNKRFEEDLVEVLTRMGHQPGETVKLQLRTLDDKHETVMLDKAAMTRENRRAIMEQRNNASGL